MNGRASHLDSLTLLLAAALFMLLGSAAEGPASLAVVSQRCSMLPAKRQNLTELLAKLQSASLASLNGLDLRCDAAAPTGPAATPAGVSAMRLVQPQRLASPIVPTLGPRLIDLPPPA